MYVFVREDLSPEQQCVQCAHSCIEATKAFCSGDQQEWVHPHLVVCGVPDEAALDRVMLRLETKSINYRAFCEPDRNNEITAIATSPIRGKLRKVFSGYRLLKTGDNSHAM